MMFSDRKLRPVTAAVLALTVLSTGCASVQQAEKSVAATLKTAVDIRDAAVANAVTNGVTRTARPRLAGEEVVVNDRSALPPIFGKRVVYSTFGAQTMTEVLDAVGALAGVRVSNQETASGGANASASQTAGQIPSFMGSDGRSNAKTQMEFSGSFRALFDELANRSSSSWRYIARTNTVEFYKYETKTLSVYLPPGAKTVNANISLSGVSGGDSGGGSGGSGGGSGSNSGGGNVSVTQNLTVNPWASIMGGIQSILSEGSQGNGQGNNQQPNSQSSGNISVSGAAGRAAASPEMGLITVTARPSAVSRIVAYVESVNQRFAQNVVVDVKIYNLQLDNQSSLGFSLDLLYKKLGNVGVSVVGASPLVAGNTTPGQLTISAPTNGSMAGSTAVVNALRQFGNVALQTQGQVIAINGQPSPIQVANEVNYLASSATTTAANVGTTSTLTPGTRVVGFTANFLPLVLGDNRILLQYQMSISSLTALTQVTSGTSSIQTPQISSQSLQQQAFVRDGQSIVLFGFDQDRTSADSNLSMGGASTASTKSRQMVVIVMQVSGGQKNG